MNLFLNILISDQNHLISPKIGELIIEINYPESLTDENVLCFEPNWF